MIQMTRLHASALQSSDMPFCQSPRMMLLLWLPMQRWAVALELAAARTTASESTIKQQQEALEHQSAQLSAQTASMAEHERQLEELSRELAEERQQLEKLAEQLEVSPLHKWPCVAIEGKKPVYTPRICRTAYHHELPDSTPAR